MTSDEANTPVGAEHASDAAASSRSHVDARSGRGRYSRGRRRPRRASSRPPRRAEPPATAGEQEAVASNEPAVANGPEAREPLAPPFQPAKIESIQMAIEKVTAIIGELRGVLNDMELVLEYLEDAERQQTTDQREIENLQQRLNVIHRRGDRQPQPRHGHRPAEETADAPP